MELIDQKGGYSGGTRKTPDNDDVRPQFHPSMRADEFERWYWPVSDLKAICVALKIAKSGSKAALRDRISFALRHPGASPPSQSRSKKPGSFNWAKEVLGKETIITDDISFGPNLRGFFKGAIGKKFVCHSDFMDWVRNNPGATLGDAIEAWIMLEERKDDPDFRREIASCNNYLQYLRDARDCFPELSLDDAKSCWDYKKIRPAPNGVVMFDKQDLIHAGVS